jgi:hypothetical protein
MPTHHGSGSVREGIEMQASVELRLSEGTDAVEESFAKFERTVHFFM